MKETDMSKAYLEITMKVPAKDRGRSALFGNDVVRELRAYLSADPEVRV
jgi:hypothetical protein